MKLKIFFIIAFLLISFPTFMYAQDANIQTPLSSSDAYKMLYENSKAYNDRILATIYWFIGAATTVMLVFIGANVFYNYRIRKDETATLTRNFETKIEEIKNAGIIDIETRIRESLVETLKDLTSNIDSTKKDFNDKYMQHRETQTQQIKVTSDAYNTQISALKNLYELKYSGIEKKCTDLSVLLTNQSKKNEQSLEIMKERMTAEISYINASSWFEQKVYSNALTYFCDSLNLRIKLNMPLVDHIIGMITKLLESLDGITTYNQSTVTKVITKLPSPEYDINKERITTLLKNLPVK